VDEAAVEPGLPDLRSVDVYDGQVEEVAVQNDEAGGHAQRESPGLLGQAHGLGCVDGVGVVHIASRHTYGVPRMHAELLRPGWRLNRKRVASVMRERDIRGATRRSLISFSIEAESGGSRSRTTPAAARTSRPWPGPPGHAPGPGHRPQHVPPAATDREDSYRA
jgi:HTH-like domain